MTTARSSVIQVPGRPPGLTSVSITGRAAIHMIYREVWADQVDDHGADCPFCQQTGSRIECNVYVPTLGGDTDLFSACRCCAPIVALDHPELDPGRDAIIEYAKGYRL